jgi:SAM-dependent methyltransferase
MTGDECPACGSIGTDNTVGLAGHSPAAVGLESASGYSMRHCESCHTEFALPRKAADGAHYHDFGEFYGWRWEFSKCLADLAYLVGRGSLLEVGCGEGLFLGRLPEGFSSVGVDLNQPAIEKARARGLTAIYGDIEEVHRWPVGSSFDAVAMFHVLEHTERPAQALHEIGQLLKPGGWLFLSVPNQERALARVVREHWDLPPHHLTRFSVAGLNRLLSRCGFEAATSETQPLDISVLQVASLAADAVLADRGIDSRRLSRRQRIVRKLIPMAGAIPRAWRACWGGGGNALYVKARWVG